MRPYNPQKKKIRGWKRRVRQVEQWGEQIKQPYLKYFLAEGGRYTYERCYLSPFYRLDKRQPPLWFYKLIIDKFITAYYLWEEIFKQLNAPHDLQLWLYDPSYISSEIICHKMQNYDEVKRFSWESDLSKKFPYDKLKIPGHDLSEFDWLLADDEHVHFVDDFDYADFTAEDLSNDGYIKKVQNNGVAYYTKRVGDIWIGRRRGNLNADSKSALQGYYVPPK